MAYFQNLYREEGGQRPYLDDLSFKQISAESKVGLEVSFTEEEILVCLKEYNGDKAPGPDSFHVRFYQNFWEVIKEEVMAVFRDFHRLRSFAQSINSTFLVIIPKIIGANNVKDFRPISLVGSLYKLLARRMSKVLGEVIAGGGNQNNFVAGRQILDAVMVTNEVVADMTGQKKEGVV